MGDSTMESRYEENCVPSLTLAMLVVVSFQVARVTDECVTFCISRSLLIEFKDNCTVGS